MERNVEIGHRSLMRAVRTAVIVVACACGPRPESAPVAARSDARRGDALQIGTATLAERLAGSRQQRQRFCGGDASGPALFVQQPEVVAWTAAEPQAVASDGGVVCWVEDGDPQRIIAVSAAGGPPREVATAAAVLDLHAHRRALFWSDGGRVLRTSIAGATRARSPTASDWQSAANKSSPCASGRSGCAISTGPSRGGSRCCPRNTRSTT